MKNVGFTLALVRPGSTLENMVAFATEHAPQPAETERKNRARKNFFATPETRRADRRSARHPRREKADTFTKTASGVRYYGFRFYSPGQGRFLNRDSIEEAGGLNLYAFVGNDPVNAWHYLGLMPPEEIYLTEPPRSSQGGGLALRLLNHYLGRSGAQFNLSNDDVLGLDVRPDVDVLQHRGVIDRMMEAMESGSHSVMIFESDNATRTHAVGRNGAVNTLGGFTIRIRGQIRNNSSSSRTCWRFYGQLRIGDLYTFENYWEAHRTFFGNVKTTLMHFFVPGVDFPVRRSSISLEQDLLPQGDAEWIGGTGR